MALRFKNALELTGHDWQKLCAFLDGPGWARIQESMALHQRGASESDLIAALVADESAVAGLEPLVRAVTNIGLSKYRRMSAAEKVALVGPIFQHFAPAAKELEELLQRVKMHTAVIGMKSV